MHLFDQRTLGVILLVLLALVVTVKKAATRSLLTDRPERGVGLWAVHVFNMFFLLVVNPAAAVLLTMGQLGAVDPTRLDLDASWAVMTAEAAGLALCVTGYLLMAWALATMRRVYQVGGSVPRAGDHLVTAGPFRVVRHPMYAAALCISLGLAALTQSLALAAVFCTYVVVLVALIPVEEAGLRRAYGDSYATYQQDAWRVVPFVY
jgi:protein-S-isoprenylcysteine O-methyltransferase Ste14